LLRVLRGEPSFRADVPRATAMATHPTVAGVGSGDAWETQFREQVARVKALGCDASYKDTSACLRDLVKSGLLRHDDIRERPDRFFAAHAILAELATSLGPGFWIRFTVHFNLFAGTVVAVGNDDQVALLNKMQDEGKLGCFGLTEVYAGVNSGLVANTTCTWHPDKQMFRLHSPDRGAYKNWISQGLVADVCVAVADLQIGGKSYGPHAFLMDLRKGGSLAPGVEMGDMGVKTVGNDLDNAWICFNDVWLPKSAMLNRYADVEGDAYVQRQKGVRAMEMIGQRLFSGRVVVARSALVFARMLYGSTKRYTDSKHCWQPKGKGISLSQVPQVGAIYEEGEKALGKLEAFMLEVEKRLGDCLRKGEIPSVQLQDAIATAKVQCVETAISLCWRLKQEVGSYALMSGSGFEQLDYLQCAKFAEGDSRILMQKMARDRVAAHKKGAKVPEREASLCEAVAKGGGSDEAQLLAYELAEVFMQRTVEEFLGSRAKL